MNTKQQVFVNEYLKCWNASEAARRAGYAKADRQGHRLLKNVEIAAAIHLRVDELKMSADEVLTRLADHARNSMADFVRVSPNGMAEIDLQRATQANKMHLIKSFTEAGEKTGAKIELYDAQSALEKLARAHGLFTDKTEITGKVELNHTIDLSDLSAEELDTLAKLAERAAGH